MSMLFSRGDVADRRPILAGPLQPLVRSLMDDLQGVMAVPLYVPEQKALLSREGGRCPADGAMLDFNPYSRTDHRCPVCGRTYRGELHDRFWIYWYQLWLAERAVHAAALGTVAGSAQASRLALDILDAYTTLYPQYANVDNALGPTRPFFSTYLESIWLLQLCIAADLVEAQAGSSIIDRFRDVVVEPSLRLIESFDEGLSNRQVWNNAALIGGHRLLGRQDRAESIVWASSGVVSHLSNALLADGTWYEGENYHFFAHRGLWYCMELVSRMDAGVPEDLVRRYDAGFRAPFLTTLPDLTFPSRRDSQYAVSLRQWRFAEMCELGLARGDDRMVRGMLARLYADDLPRGDTGRWKSTAEAERNLPATRLDRTDLGWKSLLFARPALELTEAQPLPSVLLEAQGIGVIRRNRGRVFVAVDYGLSGGGHGHPDRLNLMVSDGDRRILDDMGTGSYVDPSLHWYRSSLAHNAPFLGGRSQPRVDGTLAAYEDRGGAGWLVASASLGGDEVVTRTVVVMPDYLVDEVAIDASVSLDLPLHADLRLREPRAPERATLTGSPSLEDGFRFVREPELIGRTAANETVALTGPMADVWLGGSAPLEIWRAIAPGPPGKGDAPFLLVRSVTGGRIRSVWSWGKSVSSATLFPAVSVEAGAERHEHSRVAHGWNVAIHVSGAKSTIDLEGLRTVRSLDAQDEAIRVKARRLLDPPPSYVLRRGEGTQFFLGEAEYHRSEESWTEAGSPSADIEILNDGGSLRIISHVRADRTFVQRGAVNRLDNEQADINGAGLQLYLRSDVHASGWVIVPVAGSSALSMRPIDASGSDIPIEGSWRETPDGYRVDLLVRPPTPEVSLSLVINEKPEGRERRRGQLILSARPAELGEWIYLRGDRLAASMIDLILESD
jgi:hypothetical protein